MITYEKAKELKRNGFEQDGDGGFMPLLPPYEDGVNEPFISEKVYIPTLEELIGACGNKFKRLALHNKNYFSPQLRWSAHWRVNRKGTLEKVWGSSPSEAVSNLWLSLNRKSTA